MNTGKILRGGKPQSVKIGGVTVFTYEGAAKAFKTFSKLAYNFEKYGAEGIYALQDEAEKMKSLGFTAEELELLEVEALAE